MTINQLTIFSMDHFRHPLVFTGVLREQEYLERASAVTSLMSLGLFPQCFGLTELNISFLALLSEMAWEPSSPAPLQCFCFFLCADVSFCCGSCMVSLSEDNALDLPPQRCWRNGWAGQPTTLVSQPGLQAAESLTSAYLFACVTSLCTGCATLDARARNGERLGRPSQQPLQLRRTRWDLSGPQPPQLERKNSVQFI